MPELERLVLDRSTETDCFAVATSYADAADSADAVTRVVVDMEGRTRLDVTVEVTDVGSMSKIYVAVRSSGKANPDLATDTDWSRMNRVANVDISSGIDTSVPLVECIAVSAVGRHTLTLPVTNRYVSAVVWTDVEDGKGNVYMYRGS